MKRQILILLLLLISNLVNAQKESNNWFFGNYAGITFNTDPPSIINGSSLATVEGSASISDKNGNLLFYTDGIQVWNKNNEQMPNGFDLYGSESSTQSAVIIKAPSSETLYYIFTVASQGGSRGLSYSTVDLSLNQGLGDITQKNIELYNPTCEKITAVKHRNKKDVWLISHQISNNTFSTYLITENGVNTTAVISNSGHTIDPLFDGSGLIGYMKASPNGEFLGLAHSYLNFVELFNFDNSTGKVFNPIYFPDKHGIYGIEFSKDNSKMYFISSDITGWHFQIIQVDLSPKDNTSIFNSATVVLSTDNLISALQLASDGRIYISVSGSSFLSRINYPDKKGVNCEVKENIISLGSGKCELGLPTFMQSYFDDTRSVAFDNSSPCRHDAIYFQVKDTISIQTIQWDFGDGTTSTMRSPSHFYVSSGTYIVQLWITDTSEIKYTGSKIIQVADKSKQLTINHQ